MENSSFAANETFRYTYEDMYEGYTNEAVLIIEILMVLWISIGNSLVIAAYWKYERLQTVANFFVIQLAIADLCVGASLVYMMMLSSFVLPEIGEKSIIICITSQILLVLPTLVSLLFLLVITIDRYMAIFYPLKYPSIMTKRRMQYLVAGLWIGTTLYIAISTMDSILYNTSTSQHNICVGDKGNIDPRIMGYTYLPLFLVIVILVVVLYIRILWTVKKQLDKHNSNDSTNLQKNIQLIKTAVLVIGLFVICWAPFVVLASGYEMNFFSTNQKQNMFILYMVFYHIAVMNSGMNFIVYPVRSKDFRDGFRTVLYCKERSSVNTTGPDCC
ncbi:unnamed protein product [Owenia fusiformis]|uniref:Uncharacterized protein n=1 Tax=Owenia fusiformis TaxID=6347 RepID=A0A8J1V170_OWEFU|nr:unnamed protein product [Owenia fusiformis]